MEDSILISGSSYLPRWAWCTRVIYNWVIKTNNYKLHNKLWNMIIKLRTYWMKWWQICEREILIKFIVWQVTEYKLGMTTFPHISDHPLGHQSGDKHQDGAVEERAGVATRNRRRMKGINILRNNHNLSPSHDLVKKAPFPYRDLPIYQSTRGDPGKPGGWGVIVILHNVYSWTERNLSPFCVKWTGVDQRFNGFLLAGIVQ